MDVPERPQEKMDSLLHKAAREGKLEDLRRILTAVDRPDLTRSLTPQKNTALHIAVAFGHEQIMREMINRQSSLISQPNSNGDTPLHIAAKAGNLSHTKLLAPPLDEDAQWREAGAAALKMKNSDGYTPIHEALKKRHPDVAIHLLKFHRAIEAAYDVSNGGESLLYLSSQAGLLHAARKIIDMGNFSYRGPNGQNPLHIAVITGNIRIVEHLMKRAFHLIEEADHFGKTALHYASIIGNYDDTLWRIWILELLIKDKCSLAYESDKEGNYPLLIATINSSLGAVETILKYCPDSAELFDRNGRNALHLAVLKNDETTLGFLIERPEFKMLINQPDNDGNTPMHLATQHNYDKIVELLLTCTGLDLAATNAKGLTAMDICGYTPEQLLIHHKLKDHGAVPSCQLWKKMLLMPAPQPPSLPPASQAHRLVGISSNKKVVTNALLIVSTLVATVTFAAAFTVPGGYKNDGDGLPVFIKNAALTTFFISDTIAFCSSMAATILLIYAGADPTNMHLSTSALNTCAYISAVAIPATLTAFVTGIYVLTSKENLGLAVTSILLGCVVPVFVFLRIKVMKIRTNAKNQPQKELKNTKKAPGDVLENDRGAREDFPMGSATPATPNVDASTLEI